MCGFVAFLSFFRALFVINLVWRTFKYVYKVYYAGIVYPVIVICAKYFIQMDLMRMRFWFEYFAFILLHKIIYEFHYVLLWLLFSVPILYIDAYLGILLYRYIEVELYNTTKNRAKCILFYHSAFSINETTKKKRKEI